MELRTRQAALRRGAADSLFAIEHEANPTSNSSDLYGGSIGGFLRLPFLTNTRPLSRSALRSG